MTLRSVVLLAALLGQAPSGPAQTPQPHRLDPLSAAEITAVTDALRAATRLTASTRVVTLELAEPNKATARPARTARAVLYDWSSGRTTEQTVDVARRAVGPASVVSTGDPPIRRVIISRANEIALSNPKVLDALRRRGVTATDRVTFLGGISEGTRLPRRGSAIPITVAPIVWDEIGEGMEIQAFGVQVDLAAGVVENIFDPPFAPGVGARRGRGADTPAARPLQPLVISQPNGPSFQIRGSEIVWDRWRLHFGVHPRRGVEVFDVSIVDGTRNRPVLYRAGLSELITPYGDPENGSWYPRDAGDYGMTIYSAARASAILEADAPSNASFAPAIFSDDMGRPVTIARAVAIYERDGGVLWRHSNRAQRARQLVLSGYSTVDNYDYLFNWVFGQDGTIEVQVQLTGVMNVRPVLRPEEGHDGLMYSHLVAPQTTAPNHQHFFNWRLDFDVDGERNQVFELNTSNAQQTLRDRVGEWFGMEQRSLRTEMEARRDVDLGTARRWLVASGRSNTLGQPTAYALVPGENAPPFQTPDSAPRRKAAFLNHHLWVTLFDPAEMYASGEWVNLMREGEGVAAWSAANRPIVDRDVVLWYTVSVLHLPRPEDWPVMPVHTAGFQLVPVGFFTSNPTAPADK
jgi:primary-amine oxidase